ncbi:MAG TPA: DUF2867 domain-containing protein [Jatrophihabitantaceae bacterium]
MSAVFEIVPRPDWASTTTVAIPAGLTSDPEVWAKAIFDSRTVPSWVKALFVIREGAVRLLRITPGNPQMLAVDRVVGDEALIDTDDVHLHFAAGVRAADGLLHVTTAVALKGWRGQLYFTPVRLLHDAVTRSMMNRAVRKLTTADSLP